MKRSPELRELSVDHHHGLVAARLLRWAEEGREPLGPAVELFLHAWGEEIQPHFRLEEELLLPRFAEHVPPDHPLIVRTLTEHVILRRQVLALAEAVGDARQSLAGVIGRTLDEHIRFEERVLFPAVEAAMAGEPLRAIGKELARAHATLSCRLNPAG